MNRHGKSFVLVSAFLLFIFPIKLTAQVSCDPDDVFYTIAEGWELRGIVERLPSLRPYPLQVIHTLVDEVMQNGSETDKKFAQSYYEKIFCKPWAVSLETNDTVKLVHGDDTTGNQLEVNPSVHGDLSLMNEFITAGYKIGFYDTTADPYNFLPIYQNFLHDSIHDAATIGPFSSYLDGNTSVAVGSKDFYFQTGVYRSGFGPYLNEGLALNDSAYHSANISFHLNGSKWAYTQQLSALGATTNADPLSSDVTYSKYLSFHSMDLYLNKKMTFTYYETIVYGRRFDPSYLVPAPYMVSQGITGCNDNLQMGIIFSYKPVLGFAWNTDVYVDDFSVNDLAKLNLDSKNRIAAKTGFIYTPVDSFCTRLALDYTAITPYMYAHWDYDSISTKTMSTTTVNYQNYSNNGICMGSSYPPNSDRISFTMDLNPIQRIHLQITSAFMRHANVCESLTQEEAATYLLAEKGVYETDGSMFTHSMFAGGNTVGTAWDHLNFLTQADKMYIVQSGISATCALKKIFGCEVSFKCSYMFEYIMNKGVDSNIYEGRGNYTANDDGTYMWDGSTYSTKDALTAAVLAAVAEDKSAWQSKLYDVLDNYISFGVVITY